MAVPSNYSELTEYLSAQYPEVSGCEFYHELFPDNECAGELSEDYSRPNAVYLYTDQKDEDTKRRMRRRIMLADTWEQDYMDYVERNESTLCGGLVYRSRSNKLQHAQRCNALIIDLDGVGLKEIRNLFLRFGKSEEIIRTLPMPTYIVTSGKGIHVYYVFEEPVDLFPYIKSQLKSLKHDLTFRMWEYKSTSQFENIQYQSINQGFRMVGSMNNKYGCVVRAYRIGDKVSIDYLNRYVKSKVDLNQRFRPSRMTKEEAKIAFPDWYAKMFDEDGNKRKDVERGKWDIKGKVNGNDPYALYHWWIDRSGEVKGGHRYFFMMCMSIYASKCDVPKKKLKADMLHVFEQLKQIEHDNPMTREDMESALEMYSKEYWNFRIDDISRLTDIVIQKNKRNGRKQKQHCEVMRAIQNITNPNWRDGNGRPKGSSKQRLLVEQWRAAHPDGRKADCIRETGLSKPTVYKWWDVKSVKTMQEQAEELIFTESEMTLELMEALARNGVRQVNVVPDSEYQSVVFEKWLQEQNLLSKK